MLLNGHSTAAGLYLLATGPGGFVAWWLGLLLARQLVGS